MTTKDIIALIIFVALLAGFAATLERCDRYYKRLKKECEDAGGKNIFINDTPYCFKKDSFVK